MIICNNVNSLIYSIWWFFAELFYWTFELNKTLDNIAVFVEGTDAGAILTARHVLYMCLDGGLRLISPFMPFISEELYQRLPRWSPQGEPPSVTVTPFPRLADYAFR